MNNSDFNNHGNNIDKMDHLVVARRRMSNNMVNINKIDDGNISSSSVVANDMNSMFTKVSSVSYIVSSFSHLTISYYCICKEIARDALTDILFLLSVCISIQVTFDIRKFRKIKSRTYHIMVTIW